MSERGPSPSAAKSGGDRPGRPQHARHDAAAREAWPADAVEVGVVVGPWGVRGMAEMPYLPLAPAIAAAIHDATGVWIDEFPYTPDRVLAHLQAAGKAFA